MDDLINRQEAIDEVKGLPKWLDTDMGVCLDYSDVIGVLEDREKLPSAQSKTGEWVWSEDNASWCCGTCGCVFEEIDWKPEYNFCPNCGADMRGDEMKAPKYFYFRVKVINKGTGMELEDASDVDVVEVIRCKDCKYQSKGANECESWNLCEYRSWVYVPTDDDEFCSKAVRREPNEVR